MKTHRLLFLLCLAGVGCLQAQTTISLTFTATYNGLHQPLDSISITNLTQGGDTTLYGTDTVLVLEHGIGIDKAIAGHSGQLILYPVIPNPMTHSATVRLFLPADETIYLKLSDMSGRELATLKHSLPAGLHTFTLTPGRESFYLLSVQAGDQQQVQKLVSLAGTGGNAMIAYSGIRGDWNAMKLSLAGFPWAPGDNLRFIGYTLQGNDTIDAQPVQSTQYTFQYSSNTGTYPAGYVHCTPSNPTVIVDVTNPTTGRIWMDRNLGASQAATGSTDPNSYGDLYQWGRFADGHQCRTSDTTSTISATDQPGHGNFILAPSSPYDWRSPQNDNLWQGVSGTNNPCPTGYRLPTEVELNAERLSWSSNNAAGAFASPLKLPMAGYRNSSNGSLFNVGSYGSYWSSTVSGTDSRNLYFISTYASMGSYYRAYGFSVRCIKD